MGTEMEEKLVTPKLMQPHPTIFLFWCPACECSHQITINEGTGWKFDGNIEAPTFHPSVKHTYHTPTRKDHVCHYFIVKGEFHFCGDSTHKLAGHQGIPMVDLPTDRDVLFGNGPKGWGKDAP